MGPKAAGRVNVDSVIRPALTSKANLTKSEGLQSALIRARRHGLTG
jgi:hypothetical protein